MKRCHRETDWKRFDVGLFGVLLPVSVSNMISEKGDESHEPDASLPGTRLEPEPLLSHSIPVDQTHEWTG